MKFIVVIVALLLVFLFYPFHDLYVKDNPFLPAYTLAARGFWTEQACRQAGENRQVAAYRCRRGSTWDRMFGAAVSWGHVEERSPGR